MEIKNADHGDSVLELLNQGVPMEYPNRTGRYIKFIVPEEFKTAVSVLRNAGFKEFKKGEKTGDFRIADALNTIEIQGRICIDENDQVIIAPTYEAKETKVEQSSTTPLAAFFQAPSPSEKYSTVLELLEQGVPRTYNDRPGQYIKFRLPGEFNAAVNELRKAGFQEYEKGDKTGDFRIAGKTNTIEIQGRICIDENDHVIIAPSYLDSMRP